MKQKELIQIIVAVVILGVAGLVIFTQLKPKSSARSKSLTYEKITKLQPEFSTESLKRLSDASITKDFYAPPDLKSGVGNPQPFNPVR